MFDIVKKKTTQISDEEILSIYDLFERIFHKKRTVEEFKEQFLNTSLGYSFHAIAIDNNKIVGHNVYIPFRYYVDDKSFLTCLSVDAMTHPDYRGKGMYKMLLRACEEMAIVAGCKLRIGFPNDNSYPIQVNKFHYNDIGRLNTYCLPISIGGFKHYLSFLNPISKIVANFLYFYSYSSRDGNIKEYKFRKDLNDFNLFRYKWFHGQYEIVEKDGVTFIFKDSDFKGSQATFIMDIFPMNKRNFDFAVREIYKRKYKSTPFILYVGNLSFSPKSMIKIPRKFEPKHFHFVTKILDSDFIGPESLDINNWELNLSNYDLL